MRTPWLLLLCAWTAWADVPPLPRPPRPDDVGTARCTFDAECTITTFSGCCSPCPSPPYATLSRDLEPRTRRCAVVDCSMPVGVRCEAVAPVANFRAACERGRCAAVAVAPVPPPPPPSAECSVDSDCRVDFADPGPGAACRSSPCGCCPGTSPRAVSVRRAEPVPLVRPPPPPRGPAGAPPFGLSQPGRPQLPPPQCSPCPSPPRAAAGCRVGRCVLVPTALR